MQVVDAISVVFGVTMCPLDTSSYHASWFWFYGDGIPPWYPFSFVVASVLNFRSEKCNGNEIDQVRHVSRTPRERKERRLDHTNNKRLIITRELVTGREAWTSLCALVIMQRQIRSSVLRNELKERSLNAQNVTVVSLIAPTGKHTVELECDKQFLRRSTFFSKLRL